MLKCTFNALCTQTQSDDEVVPAEHNYQYTDGQLHRPQLSHKRSFLSVQSATFSLIPDGNFLLFY